MATLGDVGAGNTLGRYELLTPIAQGGMALVWAARMKGHRGFQKIVAIKTMLPNLSDDPQFEQMFLAEAELAAKIRHGNVCEVIDLGEEDGTLYIVMEFVDGEPMTALLRAAASKVPMPISVAVQLSRDAALGLHAAHEVKNDDGQLVGLVHRDVSPHNILVGQDGVVKIVDFGIAKATTANDAAKTQAGQMKGKVPYMAPEQARGGGHRSTHRHLRARHRRLPAHLRGASVPAARRHRDPEASVRCHPASARLVGRAQRAGEPRRRDREGAREGRVAALRDDGRLRGGARRRPERAGWSR
jgi:serine/threonine protein kinase